MAKKKKRNQDMAFFIGFGLFVFGIAAIGLSAFLTTNEGKAYDVMNVDQLTDEMWKCADNGDFEKAAIIRDLIKSKQKL